MSGFKSFDGGVLWRAFIEPMNEANDREASDARRSDQGALGDIYASLPPSKDALRKKLFIPEIGRSLSLEGRIAVALNWGNELNRARIMDGDKWNADQAAAILRTLDPRAAPVRQPDVGIPGQLLARGRRPGAPRQRRRA
jgi:hypothetical protein